jgi:hypothetical protein
MMRMLVSNSPERTKENEGSSSGRFFDDDESDSIIGRKPVVKKCNIQKSHAILDSLGKLGNLIGGKPKVGKKCSVQKAHGLIDRLGNVKAPTLKSKSSKMFKAEGKIHSNQIEGIGCDGVKKVGPSKRMRPFSSNDQTNAAAKTKAGIDGFFTVVEKHGENEEAQSLTPGPKSPVSSMR